MPGKNLSREEARDRAAIIRVESYRVHLDVSAAADPGRPTFRSTTRISFDCAEPGTSSFADLLAPEVVSVELNGLPLDPAEVFDGTRVALPVLAAHNRLTVVAECAYSRTGEGLHRFVDPADGETYLYTHYEPADARRVFANFEQPDLKAPFTFTVTAPAAWDVYANAVAERVSATGPLLPGGGRGGQVVDEGAARTWEFAPTQPISTYLTAVVAGPYHVVRDHYTRELPDGGRLEIPLAATCRRSLAPYFDADEILTVTKQGLDFFHQEFDYPYPFGKYDQCFVPEYNIGAMENPGCVTFREEFVFRSKVTEAAYESRANVILHEMAHMWFGDLVTMKWWDDLWLKESFADFMGSYAQIGAGTKYRSAWITFANRRKAWAYRQDQFPTTHPITADIRDLEDAKLNFDGITYAKGAAVLKQLVAYVGRDAFFEGARTYFRKHAFGNTVLDDLLDALEETSGRDLRAWSAAWLQTSGVNTLTPELAHDAEGRITELAIRQDGTPARPHRIAVGLYDRAEDGALRRTDRYELDVAGERTVVAAAAGRPVPALVLVNDDDLTYGKVRFDERSLETLRTGLGDLADTPADGPGADADAPSLARALAWSAVWNLTRDGLMPTRDYLDLVLRFAGRESDVGVLQSLHQQAGIALAVYADPARRAEYGTALAECALRELERAAPGSDHQLAWARFLADTAERADHLRLLRGLLDGTDRIDGLTVDQELRWNFWLALAAHGRASAEELAAELARDNTAGGRRRQTQCLAALPTPEAKAEAWSSVVDSDELPNALVEARIAGFDQPGQRELTAPYAERYFAALESVWAERSIEIAMRIVGGFFPRHQTTPRTLAATDAWLSAHPDAAPALRRLVLECRDDLARALRAQECDAR
ncbi:aminopeptidase N [Kitasatospora sp. NPDC088783]|uniref:aminopeptidase N n=1 Tax=Kitasatospora sp. NPDC088783 TaxID=3364077 RepID=UPI0037F5EF84